MKPLSPRILLVFATTEGQTRQVCDRAAAMLREAGARVTLADAAGSPPTPTIAFDAVVLAGSLHQGRYQPALVAYARTHRLALNAARTALLSVSLSAAGSRASDLAGLQRCVGEFAEVTGWKPGAVHHVAGTLRYSRYGAIKRRLMWLIARSRGLKTSISRDYSLTDYRALERFLLGFAGLPGRTRAA